MEANPDASDTLVSGIGCALRGLKTHPHRVVDLTSALKVKGIGPVIAQVWVVCGRVGWMWGKGPARVGVWPGSRRLTAGHASHQARLRARQTGRGPRPGSCTRSALKRRPLACADCHAKPVCSIPTRAMVCLRGAASLRRGATSRL